MQLKTAIILVFILFAFTAPAPASEPSAQESVGSALRKVRLQLVWLHQFQFAGYYAAKEKGYYKEAGFDVEIVQGDPDRTPLDDVASGKAQFGVARSELLLNRLRGKPVVALAAVLQHSALIMLSKKSSGIYSPHDMKDRRVMLPDGDDRSEYHAVFFNEGIPLDQMILVQHRNPCPQGKVRVQWLCHLNDSFATPEAELSPQL